MSYRTYHKGVKNTNAMHMTRILFVATICIPFMQIATAPTPIATDDLEFLILHNNDMHARFEQTGVNSNRCLPQDIVDNKCYGGFARTAHEIRRFREEAAKPGGIPVLYLNAGDTYTGTPWFTIFRDNITAAFLNVLQPDAISLGNHEFDEGVEGLVPFLNEVNFPVLAANLDLTKVPEMRETKSLKKSTIFTINGVKIGVIGYLTPDTKKLTIPNAVEILPEVESINKEADVLKKDGVNIIIALGHSGFETDKNIARNCPDVDIVIGGHTNTFLYNGKQPSIEIPEGPYPVVIEQSSGKKVPAIQAFAYTKYLGKLKVKFDANGNLIHFDGQPILLNASIPQDSDVLKLLELYRPAIIDLEYSVVGYTKVILEGNDKICRIKECNLGNMIADSMVYVRALQTRENLANFWTDAAIAFVQGGGIRASIDKKSDGAITKEDVLTVLPFKDDLYVIEVPGGIIRSALELSASKLDDKNSNGGFLQMSGVHVVYNRLKPIGQRVISVQVLCADCDIPKYSDLDDNKRYKVILSKFLLKGGDGYLWTSNDPMKEAEPMKVGDAQATIDYIKARSPVYPSEEWRIIIDNTTTSTNENHTSSANMLKVSAVIPLVLYFLTKLYS